MSLREINRETFELFFILLQVSFPLTLSGNLREINRETLNCFHFVTSFVPSNSFGGTSGKSIGELLSLFSFCYKFRPPSSLEPQNLRCWWKKQHINKTLVRNAAQTWQIKQIQTVQQKHKFCEQLAKSTGHQPRDLSRKTRLEKLSSKMILTARRVDSSPSSKIPDKLIKLTRRFY